MKIQICPYCDSVMAKKHHCDACGSFVWKAQEVEGNYKTEADVQAGKSGSEALAHQSSGKKKKYSVFFWVCAGIIGIGVFLASETGERFIGEAKYFFEDIFAGSDDKLSDDETADDAWYDNTETHDTFELYNFDTENGEQNFADGIWEYETGGQLEEEDVIARGQECNAYIHLPIKLDEGVDAVMRFCTDTLKLKADTLAITAYPSENDVTHIGNNEKTVFEKRTVISSAGNSGVYINVTADTVTENIHQITATAGSEEEVKEVIRFMAKTASGQAPAEDFVNSCLEFKDGHDFSFTEFENFEIYVSHNSSDYYISLSAV